VFLAMAEGATSSATAEPLGYQMSRNDT